MFTKVAFIIKYTAKYYYKFKKKKVYFMVLKCNLIAMSKCLIIFDIVKVLTVMFD